MAKRGVMEHPKNIELAAQLGIPELYSLGVLEAFWQWVSKYHQNGDITGTRPVVLARSLWYPGDPEVLWSALVACGFIDERTDGSVIVHDWSEHAENSVHQYLKKRGECFADGHKPFTRNQARDESGSQTDHEPTVNRSRLPQPLPKPKPSTPPPKAPPTPAQAEPTGGVVPELLPDGTRRMSDAELEAFEAVGERIGRLVLAENERRAYRGLFTAGLTPGLLLQVVDEVLNARSGTRVTSLLYFVPALERALAGGPSPGLSAQSTPSETERWIQQQEDRIKRNAEAMFKRQDEAAAILAQRRREREAAQATAPTVS